MVRVIDEDEDYLYMFDDPTINWDGINGKFIVVNDFTEEKLLEKLQNKFKNNK